MADVQPSPTPAPDGGTATPPQEPAPKQADAKPGSSGPTPPQQTPENPLSQLSDEEKNYLKGQGIEDLNSPEAIRKIINHGRTSQKTLSELQNKVKGDPPPQGGATGSQQPEPSGPQQPTGPESKGLDELTAFTLSTSLAANYPELKDDLTSGKLYEDMKAIGIPLTVDGKVNLSGINNFARSQQRMKQLEAKVEESSKPGADAIPDANPQEPKLDEGAEMSLGLARAIVLQGDTTHKRYDEASKYLQDNVGKKK